MCLDSSRKHNRHFYGVKGSGRLKLPHFRTDIVCADLGRTIALALSGEKRSI